jgi:hypothetical protein
MNPMRPTSHDSQKNPPLPKEPSTHEERALSDAEIEAILAAEGASPPMEDQAATPLSIVQRQPGQGPLGKWVAWAVVTFILLGGLKYWFNGN